MLDTKKIIIKDLYNSMKWFKQTDKLDNVSFNKNKDGLIVSHKGQTIKVSLEEDRDENKYDYIIEDEGDRRAYWSSIQIIKWIDQYLIGE